MKHILECRLLLLNDLTFSYCFTVYPCQNLLCPLVTEWLVHLSPVVVVYTTGDLLVISLWSHGIMPCGISNEVFPCLLALGLQISDEMTRTLS